ncbi:MAG: hypothetical protein AB7S48_00485 [Bacteroidales bacterium]
MKTVKIITLIFFTSLLFAGCSKDDSDVDETGKGTGTLTIKGVEYEMAEGILYTNTESVGPPYNFDIDLKTSPTNSGIGEEKYHLVLIEMYTSTKDDLQSGTYNFDTYETSHAGTFGGLIFMDFNKDEDFSYFYIIKSGTILVNKPEAGYEITIDVTADRYEYDSVEDDFIIKESDVSITCYYIGGLKKSSH